MMEYFQAIKLIERKHINDVSVHTIAMYREYFFFKLKFNGDFF